MKVLVCGGRDYIDEVTVINTLNGIEPKIKLLIHGNSPGADTLADRWAMHNGVQVARFPANWTRFGDAAGPIRNGEMVRWLSPDLVIAFPGGKGTASMAGIARRVGIRVMEIGKNGKAHK